MLTETLTSRDVGCGDRRRLLRPDGTPVEWIVSGAVVPYPDASDAMRLRATAIAGERAPEAVWLLEHPPLYTAGTSARPEELLMPDRFPVYPAGRGGHYTYHGPGQRVAYVMLDLRRRGRDVRCFVQGLEAWIIDTLAAFDVVGERREGRVGVWVSRSGKGPGQEDKIAALGVRVSRWVSLHGIAINVAPDLQHFGGIVPCGIADRGVTSLKELGRIASLPQVDAALRVSFEAHFGPTATAPSEGLVSTA